MIEKLTFGLFNRADARSFMRLTAYIKPYKIRIIGALIAIIGIAMVESYLAAFIAPLINQGFAAPSEAPILQYGSGFVQTLMRFKEQANHFIWGTADKVWIVPLFFMFLVTVRGICRFVSSYLLSWVGLMAVARLRSDMFAKMLMLPSSVQQELSSGVITGRFLVQAGVAINNASEIFITLVRDGLIVIGLTFVLFYLNWQLTLIVLVMFPILSRLSRYYRDRLKSVQSASQNSIGEISAVINEMHQGHRVVKMFGGHNNALERFATVNNKIISLQKKMNQASSARSPLSEVIACTALAFVIFFALWQSQKGITTIGEFMAFIVAMMQIVAPLKNLSNISIPMQAMFIAADTVCEFLDSPDETDNGKQTIAAAQGNIDFKNIDVQYPNQEQKALNRFNLSIRSGEKIALVGRSGSGKTTAINLLTRFVLPNSGEITLDGINIDNIKLANLRQQFSLVSQDVFLFDDTLYNNIRYSRPDASDEEIEAALKAANLWDLVQQSPDGMHQHIGADGNNLSGGQRQRVSIARAILKDAPILLLDEATSALDNESERLIQQALERLMQKRTSIIVAHRLSTIEHADRIIVMDGGKIIEQGSHSELIDQNGYYAKLSNMPFVPE